MSRSTLEMTDTIIKGMFIPFFAGSALAFSLGASGTSVIGIFKNIIHELITYMENCITAGTIQHVTVAHCL